TGLEPAGGVRHLAPPDGGADEPTGSARICSGPAAVGGLRSGRRAGGSALGSSDGGAQLRRGEASSAMPGGAPTAASGPGLLSLPAESDGREDQGRVLHAAAVGRCRGRGMSDAPEILLAHHLKALKLPTFLREHQKLA